MSVEQPPKPRLDRKLYSRWIAAWVATLVIGVLSEVTGLIALSQNSSSLLPPVVIILGILYLALGAVVALKKSQAALIAAVVIYGLDTLLAIVGGLTFTALVLRAVLLGVMIGGIVATKKIAIQSKIAAQSQGQTEVSK